MKKWVIAVISVALLLIISATAVLFTNTKNTAPLGLKWGMKPEEVLLHVGSMEEKENHPGWYRIEKPVKSVQGIDNYAALFDNKRELSSIDLSEQITDDVFGIKGESLYKKHKKILTDKYGKPTNISEYMGGNFYKKSDGFYNCLAIGCGSRATYFNAGGMEIELALVGFGSKDEGLLFIVYKSPNFVKARKKIEAEKDSKAADGL